MKKIEWKNNKEKAKWELFVSNKPAPLCVSYQLVEVLNEYGDKDIITVLSEFIRDQHTNYTEKEKERIVKKFSEMIQ